MKAKHYDVFVIGSGIAGQTAAKICREHGMSVAMADIREYGGVCANRGCDPKRILLHYAEIIHDSSNLKGLGVDSLPKIDFEAAQRFKKSFTQPVPNSTERELKKLGFDLYHQSPQFIGKNEIMVEGKRVTADYFIIASGMVPRPLEITGHELSVTSEEVLNLNEIPESTIFIGSGYVALEFAYLLATLGSEVKVLEINDKALSNFDQFLVDKLVKKLESLGVEFIFNAETQSLKKLRTNIELSYKKNKKEHSLKAKFIVNATGRVPSVMDLDLEKASIKWDKNGIEVNDFLQSTSNRSVYACGDVSSKSLPLTPLSGLQGYIVGNNIVKEKSKTFEVPCVPSVVFTNPNLASVGMSEEQAKARFKNVKVYQGDASDWFNAKRLKEDTYAYKILANERTGEILGAHLLGTMANESINIFATAIFNKMTVYEFKKMIFTYPSFSQDLKAMLADH